MHLASQVQEQLQTLNNAKRTQLQKKVANSNLQLFTSVAICIWDDRKTNQDCTEIYPDNSNSPLKLELFFVSLKSSSSPPGFYCSHEQVCLNAMYYKYFSFQLIILFSV